MKMNAFPRLRRFLAAFLAGVLLWTEGASPIAAARGADNLWAERRRARQEQSATFLASLPASWPLGQVTRSLTLEPSPVSTPLPQDPALPDWMSGWPLSTVQVDEIRSQGRPDVILVKDLHAQLEAQRNIAAFLTGLARDGRPVLVGVEGASGPLDFRPFRAFGNKRFTEQLADAYLSWDWIQAPEYAGLTGPDNLRFSGVEDEGLYKGNIRAYRRADKARPTALAALERIDDALETVKARVFTPAQRRMDQAARQYRSGQKDTGAFLEVLQTESPSLFQTGHFPQITLFLRARAMEASLDFNRAQQERELFLLRLSQALSPEELRSLISEAVRFRTGDRGAGAFHESLLARARRAGVNPDGFPAFSAYVRYASLADGIDRAALFGELEKAGDAAWSALAPTAAQTDLRTLSQDESLAEKLVKQSLSDEEWAGYQKRRDALLSLSGRARAVGAEAPPVHLAPFEDFYRFAQARNGALTRALLAARSGEGATVLVAGGFHARGVAAELKKRGLGYVVLSPRIEKIDASKNSLDLLVRGPTSLDRLLMGDTIFLAKPVVMGLLRAPGDETGAAAVLQWPEFQVAQAAAASPAHPAEAAAQAAQTTGNFPVFALKRLHAEQPSYSEGGGVMVPVQAETAGGRLVEEDISFGETAAPSTTDPVVLPLAGGELKLSVGDGDPVPVTVRAHPTRADRVRKAARWILPMAEASALIAVLAGVMNPATLGLLFAARLGKAVSDFRHEPGHIRRAEELGVEGADTPANRRGNLRWLWLTKIFPIIGSLTPAPGVQLPGRRPAAINKSISIDGFYYGVLRGWPVAALSAALIFAVPDAYRPLAWALGAGFGLSVVDGILSDVLGWKEQRNVFRCGIGAASEDIPGDNDPDGQAHAVAHHLATVIYVLHRSSERGAQQAGFFIKMLAPADKTGNKKPVYLMIKVNPRDRRDMVIDVLEQEIYKQVRAAQGKRYSFPPEYMESIGHTRYGTNTAAPKVINAQPFIGAPPYEASSWITDEQGKLVEIMEWRAHTANHNGDQNKMHLYEMGLLEGAPEAGHHQTLVVSNTEMREIEKKATGYATPSAGDSPMITREMDFLYETEGALAESLRAALLMAGFASFEVEGVPMQDENGHRLLSMEQILERVTTPGEAAPVIKVFEHFFKEHAQDLAAGANLEEVYRKSGGASMDEFPTMQDQVAFEPGSPLAKLSGKLESSMYQAFAHLPWVEKLSPEDRRKILGILVSWSLRYFVINGPFMAGVHLLRNSDPTSTYGVSLSGLHNNGDFVWGCLNQPVYIWVSEDGKFVGAASESNALKGARGKLEDLPFRYTMKDGEVAHYDRKAKTVTVYNIFTRKKFVIDVKNMAEEAKNEVVVDMRNNRYVTTPLTVHPKNRARNDLRRVVDLLKRLSKSFSERPAPKDDINDSRFWNFRTSEALSDLLVKKIGKRLKSGGEANYIDVLLFGTAQDRDVAENMAEEWRRLTGQILRIEVMDAASYSGSLEDYPLNKDTIVLAVDHFGLGANAVFAGKFLKEMKDRGKCGEIFLMAGGVDNPFSEKVLGQNIHDHSPFLCRNIVTMPRMSEWYPAEARSLTNIAPQRAVLALTRHVFGRVAEAFPDFRPSHEYEGKFADVIPEMDKMIARYDELTESIVGFDADGNPLKSRGEVERSAVSRDRRGNPVDRDGNFLKNNALHDRITKITAKRLSQHVLETKDAFIITALHLVFTFLTGQTLPGLVFKGIFRLTGFALFDTARFAVGSLHFGLFLGAAAAVFFFVRSLLRIHNENKDREVPMKRGLLLNTLILTASLSVGLCFGQLLSFPMGWGMAGLNHLIAAGGLPSSILAVARAGLWLLNPHLIPLGFTLDFSVPALVNVPFYMVFGWIVSVFILRVYQKRDLWARLGSRTITFADVKAHVGDRAARYLRRLRGLNYAIADFAAIYGSTIGKVVWDLSGASNARGGLYVIGVPRSETHSEAAQMATKHLRAVQNGRTVEFTLFGKTFSWDLKTGPEMIGIGFDPDGGAPFQDYILLDDGKKGGDLSYASSPFLRNLNEGLCEANLRLVAQQVLSEETDQLVASATEVRRVGATQNTTLDGTTQQPYGPISAEKAETLSWPMLERIEEAQAAIQALLEKARPAASADLPLAASGRVMNGTAHALGTPENPIQLRNVTRKGTLPAAPLPAVAPAEGRYSEEISIDPEAPFFRRWNEEDHTAMADRAGKVTPDLIAHVKTFLERMGLPQDTLLRTLSWTDAHHPAYRHRLREASLPPMLVVPTEIFNAIIAGRSEEAAEAALHRHTSLTEPAQDSASGEIRTAAGPSNGASRPSAPKVVVDPALVDAPLPAKPRRKALADLPSLELRSDGGNWLLGKHVRSGNGVVTKYVPLSDELISRLRLLGAEIIRRGGPSKLTLQVYDDGPADEEGPPARPGTLSRAELHQLVDFPENFSPALFSRLFGTGATPPRTTNGAPTNGAAHASPSNEPDVMSDPFPAIASDSPAQPQQAPGDAPSSGAKPQWLEVEMTEDATVVYYALRAGDGGVERRELPRNRVSRSETALDRLESFMTYLAAKEHGGTRILRVSLGREGYVEGMSRFMEEPQQGLYFSTDILRDLLKNKLTDAEALSKGFHMDENGDPLPLPSAVLQALPERKPEAPDATATEAAGRPGERSAPTSMDAHSSNGNGAAKNGNGSPPSGSAADRTASTEEDHALKFLVTEDGDVHAWRIDMAQPEPRVLDDYKLDFVNPDDIKTFLRLMGLRLPLSFEVVYGPKAADPARKDAATFTIEPKIYDLIVEGKPQLAAEIARRNLKITFGDPAKTSQFVTLALLLLGPAAILASLAFGVSDLGAHVAGTHLHSAWIGWVKTAVIAGVFGGGWHMFQVRKPAGSGLLAWSPPSVIQRTVQAYGDEFLRPLARNAPPTEMALERSARGLGYIHEGGDGFFVTASRRHADDLSLARASLGPDAARRWTENLPRVASLLDRLNPKVLTRDDLESARPLTFLDRHDGRKAELAALLADGSLQTASPAERLLDAHRWGRFVRDFIGRASPQAEEVLLDLSQPFTDAKRPAVLALHVKEGYFGEMAALAAAEILRRRNGSAAAPSVLLVVDGPAKDLPRARERFLAALQAWNGPQGALTEEELHDAALPARLASAPSQAFRRPGKDGNRLDAGATREYVGERLKPPQGFALSIVSVDGRQWRLPSGREEAVRVIELFLPGLGVAITPELWDAWNKAVERSA